MIKIITGLAGSYYFTNFAIFLKNLQTIDKGLIFNIKGKHNIQLHNCNGNILSYLDDKKCLLSGYNIKWIDLTEYVFMKKEDVWKTSTLAPDYYQLIGNADKYRIKRFDSPDDCKDFVLKNNLNYDKNNHDRVNIDSKREGVFIIHNDQIYTIMCRLLYREFNKHLVKTNQLPFNQLAIILFLGLVVYQTCYYHMNE